MKRIDLLIIIFFFLTSVFALFDLWGEGLYTSHDGSHQVARLYYFDQLLRDGQFPPRWVSALQNGYGYPLFIFSYQLPWFIAEPFYLAGLSVFDSIELAFLIGYFLSALTMYFFLKKTTGRLPAVVGAFLYIFAPYRFSNIYVRAAIGDATAFIFPPLILLAIQELSNSKKILTVWVVAGAFSLAALLLSHAMVFIIFAPALITYGLIMLIRTKYRLPLLTGIIAIVVLGLGISGYYLLPSLTERGLTKFSDTVGPALIGATFMKPKDLLYTPWGYGVFHSEAGAMSLQLGIPQWIVILLTSVILFIAAIKNKNFQFSLMTMWYWLAMFGMTIFVMLPPSLVFWKFTSKYFIIDYTFRVLALSVFICAVLGAYVIKHIPFPRLAAIFFITLAIYSNRNHLRVNQRLDWPLSLYLDVETTTNTYEEYTPKWVNTNYVKVKRPKVEFTGRNADIEIIENKSNLLQFIIDAKESGDVIINSVYYPGWEFFINGQKANINPSKDGMTTFWLEPGKYTIRSRWSETPLRKTANLISLVSMVTAAFLIVIRKKSIK